MISIIDPSLFAKSKNKASTAYKNAKESEKQKEIAANEAQVYRFAEILSGKFWNLDWHIVNQNMLQKSV